MGLYLAIFEDGDELDGVEVGSYADFAKFRIAVSTNVEDGIDGSRCPILMLHSDCDGEWSFQDSVKLKEELSVISETFMKLPPEAFDVSWKREVSKTFGLLPKNLYECFFDVDGEPLLERLLGPVQISIERELPIVFQ